LVIGQGDSQDGRGPIGGARRGGAGRRSANNQGASMRRYLSVTIPLALLAGSSTLAQSPFPYYAPKLRNSKDGEVQDFPLGVLSATGRLQHGATAITVMDVGPDGPGQRAGLRVGDAIVAIEGKAMPPYSSDLDAELMGPQTALATALDEACSRPHPKLKMTVARNGQQVPLEVALPASPRYARTFPLQCPKAAAYRRAAYQWLIDHQRSDGTWPGHIGGANRLLSQPSSFACGARDGVNSDT